MTKQTISRFRGMIRARYLSMSALASLLIFAAVQAGAAPSQKPAASELKKKHVAATRPTSAPASGARTKARAVRKPNVARRTAPSNPRTSTQPTRRFPRPNPRIASTQPSKRTARPSPRMPSTRPVPHRLPRRPARKNIPPIRTLPEVHPESTEPVDYGTDDVVTGADGTKTYRLRYKFPKDSPRYLVIENEFKDRGGVPGLLTFSAEAGNRVTIVQRVVDAGMRVTPTEQARAELKKTTHTTFLEWRVDRFEAREKALGEEHKFDSLRDSYPVAPMRRLGNAPGSKVTFEIDAWTGNAERVRIQPGRSIGPTTRQKLARTTQKCLFSNDTVVHLLDDIGPLMLPRVPRRVGETWTRVREKPVRNFGKSVATIRYTLDSVSGKPDGKLVAHVSISGDTKLVSDAPEKPDAAASQPAQNGKSPRKGARRNAKQTRHEFVIDSAVISGSMIFDITNGALLEYTLRRDLTRSAAMESEKMGEMKLETGEAHTLRIRTTTTEPPKPIIVGGPKPPIDAPDDLVPSARRGVKKGAKTKPAMTAEEAARKRKQAEDYAERRRKALDRIKKRRDAARTSSRRATTQPVAVQPRPVTTRPTTSQPATPRSAGTDRK